MQKTGFFLTDRAVSEPDALTGPQHGSFAASCGGQRPKTLGVLTDDREGVIVHRDAQPRADHLGSAGCVLRAHRIEITDRQQRRVEFLFPKQREIRDQPSVARMVNLFSADLKEITAGKPPGTPLPWAAGRYLTLPKGVACLPPILPRAALIPCLASSPSASSTTA